VVKAEFNFIVEAHREWLDSAGERGLQADFSHLNLQGIDFHGRWLYWSNFRGTDLRGADLSKVCLNGADLRGADLRGAKLSGATFDRALLQGALIDRKPKGAIF